MKIYNILNFILEFINFHIRNYVLYLSKGKNLVAYQYDTHYFTILRKIHKNSNVSILYFVYILHVFTYYFSKISQRSGIVKLFNLY
jgi:hypothetical protein